VWLLAAWSTYVQGVLNCPPLPVRVPANVTDLRPNNIKVVMSLGDSVTAGFGIEGAEGGINEYRGLSFSIGGDPNATTLANFLRYYSPDIQGFSLGSHEVEYCHGVLCLPTEYHPEQDVLNAAQSGAIVANLPTHQMDYLLKELKANPAINMKEDWKLLTIFIGANDLCSSCLNKTYLEPDEYAKHLFDTLERVRMNIPRVFVQLAEIFNISQIYDLSLKTDYCIDVHRVFTFECKCIFDKKANDTRQEVDEYAQQYNARARTLAAYYQGLRYPEFTVVAQPFGRNTMLKDQSTDLLSTLDCFHPSLVAQKVMAIALWNNLLTPAADKKGVMNVTVTPLCPTPETLLYTY